MTRMRDVVDRFNADAQSKRIASCLEFSAQDDGFGGESLLVRVKAASKNGSPSLRQVDPYVMLFFSQARATHPEAPVTSITISLDMRPRACDLECFRRRFSYLAQNHGVRALLFVDGSAEGLYLSRNELLGRPAHEVHDLDEMKPRGNSRDSEGRIEKHLQTWLAGEQRKSNERLAVLGATCFCGHRGVQPRVLREYPTGIFDSKRSNKSRVLPTYWVDLVTVNTAGDLAVVELKVNDKKLDVVAQILDYALFFACYRKQLAANLTRQLGVTVKAEGRTACYIASNVFHPHFPEVARMYAPAAKTWSFSFHQLEIGRSTRFDSVRA